MTAFVALLKREWLESRFSYLVVILGLAALICAVTTVAATIASLSEGGFVTIIERINEDGDVREREFATDDPAQIANFSGWTDRELTDRLTRLRMGVAGLFHAAYFFTLVFVLLGCLYDERKDRSILFWKSMPVSDPATIASKLVVPVWLVPALVVAALAATWIFMFTLMSLVAVSEDLGSVGRLWSHGGLAVGLAQEIVGYLLQGFWGLPIYAWLVLVSAAAPRVPLLWAVLVPIALVLSERIAFGTRYVGDFLGRHIEMAALPRVWDSDDRYMPAAQTLTDQLALLATWELWLGVLVGITLLAASVWCYRRFNEI